MLKPQALSNITIILHNFRPNHVFKFPYPVPLIHSHSEATQAYAAPIEVCTERVRHTATTFVHSAQCCGDCRYKFYTEAKSLVTILVTMESVSDDTANSASVTLYVFLINTSSENLGKSSIGHTTPLK